eukprot:TRINITY_DN1745_c0_g1_i1.p1 TRINITY_DN1745_c0_g1~~TRINITY_DN1745_c0_g1_i1.p1  ORF type:complete len:362 (+),score=80.13 TRINITY_DN1745_c0_g1_i1:92-1177(+)
MTVCTLLPARLSQLLWLSYQHPCSMSDLVQCSVLIVQALTGIVVFAGAIRFEILRKKSIEHLELAGAAMKHHQDADAVVPAAPHFSSPDISPSPVSPRSESLLLSSQSYGQFYKILIAACVAMIILSTALLISAASSGLCSTTVDLDSLVTFSFIIISMLRAAGLLISAERIHVMQPSVRTGGRLIGARVLLPASFFLIVMGLTVTSLIASGAIEAMQGTVVTSDVLLGLGFVVYFSSLASLRSFFFSAKVSAYDPALKEEHIANRMFLSTFWLLILSILSSQLVVLRRAHGMEDGFAFQFLEPLAERLLLLTMSGYIVSDWAFKSTASPKFEFELEPSNNNNSGSKSNSKEFVIVDNHSP